MTFLANVMLSFASTAAVERQTLRGHVPLAVAKLNLQPVGRLSATNRLRLAIGLPLRNTNDLARLLEQIYDPASPRFRRYLTPEQFTERFGPTTEDYEAVKGFAIKHGFEVTATHPNRVVLDALGAVSEIEAALGVKLLVYRHPTEARTFYAPDVEPSVEAGLAVLDISGLNNYSIPRPALHWTPATGRARPASGSGQGGNFMGKDLRNAYAPGVSLTGAGQMVGLVEFEGFYPGDITAYENLAGLPNVPIQVVLLDGFNGVPVTSDTGGIAEADIDIQMAVSMAPGLSKVVVFEAGQNGYWNDILSAMAENPQIKQLSASWGTGSTGGAGTATADHLFQQMAAQGQSFLSSSGDLDSWVNSNVSFPPWPFDDPYLTSVGGTSLTMNGTGDSYASETVWNDGLSPPGWSGSGYWGSGGGISSSYPIPSWQQGLDMSANRGSTTMRNFPDVAMAADNFVRVANGSISTGHGGTSFAAPLWAGFVALVNQEAAANGEPPVGFLNPALYALGQSADYTNNFHDITVGNNATAASGGLFPAVPGYDLCTGWGSPKGSNLIHSLALPQKLGIAPNSTMIFTGPVGGPIAPIALTFSLTNRNASLTNQNVSLAWSLAPDAAWLTAGPTNGAIPTGGAATVITVTPSLLASNLSAGSYTANLYFSNLNDQSVQSRQVVVEIVAPPLINSQPANQTLPAGTTATFSVGTATNALLSSQWQFDSGSGVTNLTDGGGISGSRTNVLTIGNVSLRDAGAYSVIVSNAAGSVTSGSAFLTILTGQPPVIVSGPASQNLLPGASASLTVLAVGDAPLSYSWRLNGTDLADSGNLSGSATSTLTMRGATAANAGNYSVLITNRFGSLTSAVAGLSLTSVTSAGVALETLYSFTTNSLGCLPFGGLIQANNGSFYGTACAGGPQGVGTVFQMASNGAVTLLYAFPNGTGGNYPPMGCFPYTALVQGANGFLYGTTSYGGSTGDGTVFRMNTNGTGTVAWSLDFAGSGSLPYGGLVQGRDGNFYGTTSEGGTSSDGYPWGYGTIFKLAPNGSLAGIHSFDNNDGAGPCSTLVQGGDGSLYGTAQLGGTNGGWGTIFKMTLNGALTALFSFANTNGALPNAGLVQDAGGNLYGLTIAGGAYGAGTVFKLAADGTFTSLYSFTGGDDGSNCISARLLDSDVFVAPGSGGLLLASDGNLYGTTVGGGVYGLGTVFRISPDGTMETLVQFDGYQGANPYCTLIQAADGRLYGTTQNGGAYGLGAIFRLTIDSPLNVTQQPQPQRVFAGDSVAFSVATSGSLPVSYQWLENGTNLSDGGDNSGSSSRELTLTNIGMADAGLFSVVVSNVYGAVTSATALLKVIASPPYLISGPEAQTVLAGSTATFSVEAGGGALSFQWQENGTNLVDGGSISGSTTPTLILASVTAGSAGAYSVRVSNALNVVSSPSAVLTVLPVNAPGTVLNVLSGGFSGAGPLNPHAGVIQGTNGWFYGTTLNGGSGLYGTAFRWTSSGTNLHSFTGGSDGGTPFAGLTQASDGYFYGATSLGGSALFGALFRMTPSGGLTNLYSFGGGADGGSPLASLVQGSDGNLYGTASTGGSNGFGVVFNLGTHGLFAPLWSFNSTNGSYPSAPLVQGSDGQFYGTTSAGGAQDLGTVFSLSTNGIFNSLVSFDYALGAYPSNGLVQATDGAFYGTASSGGTNGGWGTVFRLTADGTLTRLHSFNYQDGAYPVGGLVQATDGNLYGTTSQGGVGGQGTVFQMTTNGVLTTLVWFKGTNGASPQGTLIQARDGYFYGTAEFGGTGFNGAPGSGDGLVFRFALPMFLSNPFTQTTVVATAPYSASLWAKAITPTGDVLSFAKVSGPAWLIVAANGVLSGTPTVADIGTNSFSISLADTNGWSSAATMTIVVIPAPLIVSASSGQGNSLLLSWTGGQPPYQVQTANDMVNPSWQNLGGPVSGNNLLLTPSNVAAFYRVQGQ
jgi:uncharacterized repeat protein (TIGR03803 family)